MKDLTGLKFGRLTVLSFIGVTMKRTPSGNRMYYYKWLCRCDCGYEGPVAANALRSKIKGCFQCRGNAIWHGRRTAAFNNHVEHGIWSKMKGRCNNPSDKKYADYGGRGIKVCDEWVKSFDAFLAYVGVRPSPNLSIDRINVNGNYEPGNVRWATSKEQANNRRCNSMHEWNGKIRTLAEIAALESVPYRALWSRLNQRGQTIDYAVKGMKARQSLNRIRHLDKKSSLGPQDDWHLNGSD